MFYNRSVLMLDVSKREIENNFSNQTLNREKIGVKYEKISSDLSTLFYKDQTGFLISLV